MLNEMFFILAGSLITLAVCLGAGYIGRKLGIITDAINTGMSGLLVKITMPCMVFISMMQPFSQELLIESVSTVLFSGAVFLAGYFIALALGWIMRASDSEKRIWQFSLLAPNAGFMGFPVVYSVYGHEGMFYASMSLLGFNLLIFSLGLYIFKKGGTDIKATIKSIAFTPVLIATYIGLVFFVTGLRLPIHIHNGIRMIGDMSITLAMVIMGAVLAKDKLRTVANDPRIIPVLVARLIIIPVVAVFALRPFVHNPMMLGVIVLSGAMPVAIITVIFAEQYNCDASMATKLITISSILCLFTIPMISLVM